MSNSEYEILCKEFWKYVKDHTGICNPIEGKTANEYKIKFKNGNTWSNKLMKAIASHFMFKWYGSYRNEDIARIIGVSVRWIQYWATKNVGEQPKSHKSSENRIDRNK